ncbi:MAG: trimeric intracellular cation channel family protein [Clostridium sp.]|nr:trimeric intracellular cation channel family protein [Clostridium sp.]
MEHMLFILDMIGTVAFALSGAMTAIKKKMDILGVMILGMVTAVGGGMIRDIILGIVPPQAFREPLYAVTALLTSIVIFTFIYFRVKGYQEISGHRFALSLLLADTLGLGVFTVVGVKAAFDNQMDMNYFLPVFLGTITGVGGGLLRDMMAGDQPYIFVKHVYACASIAGAFVCAFLWDKAGEEAAMISGAACVIIMRCLAIKFKWNLPRINDAKMLQK